MVVFTGSDTAIMGSCVMECRLNCSNIFLRRLSQKSLPGRSTSLFGTKKKLDGKTVTLASPIAKAFFYIAFLFYDEKRGSDGNKVPQSQGYTQSLPSVLNAELIKLLRFIVHPMTDVLIVLQTITCLWMLAWYGISDQLNLLFNFKHLLRS